ncbi:Methylthioribose-1-phosphate isomerase [subsurface metagenome]
MNISPEIISLIGEIKNDRTHGASQLARQAAEVLRVAAERSRAGSTAQFWREQQAIGDKLMSIRPAMAPIFNIVSGLLDSVGEKAKTADLDGLRQMVITEADKAVKASLQAVAQIAEHSAKLIAGGDRIMTHSYSSTVVAALKEAFTRHGNIEVITTRSGPGRTGAKLAQELSLCGIPVTFIDYAAAWLHLPTVNIVVVGADRVCVDGRVVNGIGTCLLAMAAERAGVPFYVLGETLKFDPRVRSDEVDLEEQEVSEAVEPGRLPPGVMVSTPAFDITPLELVTGVVTENGLLRPEKVIVYLQKRSV